MLFKLHYFLVTSGVCAISILLGVFVNEYTDASSKELGALLCAMPLTGCVARPTICSYADRKQAHQKCIMWCLLICAVSYSPFLIIPFLGPEVYEVHPRVCWYILLVTKVIGDAALGGVMSVGDSLAINYAARLKVDFSVYRIWGTFSWMIFGLIIGQVNEVSFMPKYTPAFFILVLSNLLDALLVFSYPPEYFQMVQRERARKKSCMKEKKENAFTKSLLPREVVWAHAKSKFIWLLSFGLRGGQIKNNNIKNHKISTVAVIGQAEKFDRFALEEGTKQTGAVKKAENSSVSKKTQLKIILYLMRKDLRIILYICFFICAGASLSPTSFLFVYLSNLGREGTFDFSQLVGLVQFSQAASETVLFIFIKRIKATIGRPVLLSLAIAGISLKYWYYAEIFLNYSPYFSIIAEMLQGVSFGIFLQVSVELAHIFALEALQVPQNVNKIKLHATMQSLIGLSQDGVGRALGSLSFGFFLETFGFEKMWIYICAMTAIVAVITICANIISYVFNVTLGLEEPNEDESV